MNIATIWGLIRDTIKSWNDDKAPRLAAALSYYAIFSLAPLLVLIIAIASFFIGNNNDIRAQILNQVGLLVGAKGAEIVDTLITNSSHPRSGLIATIIGVVTLFLGATGIFSQLQDALNTIWKVKPREGRPILHIIADRAQSFAMVLGLTFLMLISVVINTAISVVGGYFTNLIGGGGFITPVVEYAFSIVLITVIFAAIFKVLPDVQLKWRDVWVGALFTAVLFIIGQILISLYLSRQATSSIYGAAGSLIILLLWIYYSSQILFIGAEFTKVYASFRGTKVAPTENARPATPDERVREGLPPGEANRLHRV